MLNIDSLGELMPHQKSKLDDLLWRIQFEQQVVKEVKNNPAMQEYFARYNAKSVDNFITHFAINKASSYKHYELYSKLKEKEELRWMESANWHLKMIQYKKLMDAQGLWRAEELVIPEIELSVDFGYWMQNVMNCPFIDPVTADEVDMYIDFLESDRAELVYEPSYYHVPHFVTLKEAWMAMKGDDGEGGIIPAWFEYCYERTGTGTYLELPDIRGEKEGFYLRLGRSTQPGKSEAIQKVHEAFQNNDAKTYRDNEGKEYLSFEQESLKNFVDLFEDKTTREYYEVHYWSQQPQDEVDRLERKMKFLLRAEGPVPIPAHYDWKEALEMAADNYKLRMIAEHMPSAFEQYEFNRSMQIQEPLNPAAEVAAAKKDIKKDILLGRKLNGEPEDLNF